MLGIESSLHEIHSENKQLTGPTYKGGSVPPSLLFADATGETLAVRLRPGNAGANNVVDLVGVLDAAIDGLPAEIATGHRVSDDPEMVRRPLQVRADSAAGRTFALSCRARTVGFAVVARSNEQIHAAISRVAYDSAGPAAGPPPRRRGR